MNRPKSPLKTNKMRRTILKTYLVVGLVVLLALSSCQVSNKYRSPKSDTSAMFRDENPTDTITIADIPWRDYFRDPLLQTLIEEGLRENFDLQIAYTRIRQAEANLTMARSAYFPTVALGVQATYSATSAGNGGSGTLGTQQMQYGLGVTSTWEVDIWGKLRKQNRAQYARFLGSQSYRDLVQTSLVANIANSYYALMALDEQLRITRESLDLLSQTTETMQALMDAGMLTGASVEQSKALYYGTQVTIPTLESQIREMENSLSVLVGRKPGGISRSTIAQQQVAAQLDHGVPAQMLAKRPDVRQAELSFRAAYETTGAARANLYPALTLGTGSMFGFGAGTLTSFFRPENLLATVIGGLTQPVFQQKKLRGALEVAKAQQQEALLTFSKTALGASQEVSNILYSYQASLSKNPIRVDQVRSLTTAVEFTQELLKAGEANYTEVLTAEQNLLSAQLSQVSDKLEQLQYGVNLYKALGGGTE